MFMTLSVPTCLPVVSAAVFILSFSGPHGRKPLCSLLERDSKMSWIAVHEVFINVTVNGTANNNQGISWQATEQQYPIIEARGRR